MEGKKNRREAFRCEDEILLKVEKVELSEPEVMEAEFQQRRVEYGILTHLKYGVDKHLPTMRIIERKHPEIAQYLKFLQRQVEYISIRNSACDNTGPEFGDKQWVELSANGMRFSASGSFTEGEHIQAIMVLFPDELRIMALATVSRVAVSDDGFQEVSIHFTHLHLEDEEALIKHLHKRQIDDLRKDKDSY